MGKQSYTSDILLWSEHQANLLLAKNFDQLDLPNLIDEIISVGLQEIRAFENWLSECVANRIRETYFHKELSEHHHQLVQSITEQKISDTPSLENRYSKQRVWNNALLKLSNDELNDLANRIPNLQKPQLDLFSVGQSPT